MIPDKDKIECLHPQGKHAPAIAASTYYLFKNAIASVLKEEPLTYSAMANAVKEHFIKDKIVFNGSVGWFTETVKLDMEARGLIKTNTEKGKKFHKLNN